MNTDWLFNGIIDAEQKQYVLLSFFQKLNPQLELMKIYPMFTEVTLHLANIQNIIKHGKIIYIDKKLKSIDEELTFTDLKTKEIPILNDKEREELKLILKYSENKLQDYFNVIKSIWTIVYDSIEVVSILNDDNLTSKIGYFYIKLNGTKRVWEYKITKYRGVKKTKFVEKTDTTFLTTIDNKTPVFYFNCSKEVPFEETLLPLMKRKLMSYIYQSKNLVIKT